MATLMAREAVAGSYRLRWTQAALENAVQGGALDPERHYEIINGELYEKMGQGWPHTFAVDALVLAFRALDPGLFHVSVQTPLKVGQDLPEPDFKVLRGSLRARRGIASAEETMLVVEVADATHNVDLRVKAPMYAASGIPIYWIVDVKRRRVEIHARPEQGAYAETMIFDVGHLLPPPFEGFPEIPVADMFVEEAPEA